MRNLKFQNALNRLPQAVPPIWMMRQAGRYHQHYQQLRKKHSFMDLCKIPELAAEVALGPIKDFDFDVAILFSDLLFPLETLGFGLTYEPGPQLGWHLDESSWRKMGNVEEAARGLEFQGLALKATRDLLPKDKSLIGFVGGPWTLYTYATEGAHKGSLAQAKTHLQWYERFCEKIVPLLKLNIKNQLQSGAELVMVFDTAAGELSPSYFNQWIIPGLQELAAAFPRQLGYYSRGTQAPHLAGLRKDKNWAGLGFDSGWDLSAVLRESPTGFVQGNFDQALLAADAEVFAPFLRSFIEPLKALTPKERSGWVCGLGHGVIPVAREENVRRFVNEIREAFQ